MKNTESSSSSQVIKFTHPGSLIAYGYRARAKPGVRRAALAEASKKEGNKVIAARLNALVVLSKSRPELLKIYSSDLEWVKKARRV